jgi:hypothetical protein
MTLEEYLKRQEILKSLNILEVQNIQDLYFLMVDTEYSRQQVMSFLERVNRILLILKNTRKNDISLLNKIDFRSLSRNDTDMLKYLVQRLKVVKK